MRSALKRWSFEAFRPPAPHVSCGCAITFPSPVHCCETLSLCSLFYASIFVPVKSLPHGFTTH